jgi:D-alanyl-D-alanine dipeptidase
MRAEDISLEISTNLCRMKLNSILLVMLVVQSCSSASSNKQNNSVSQTIQSPEKDVKKDSLPQEKLLPVRPELVDVQIVSSAIKVDLKYTYSDNFIGDTLYFLIKKAYLQKDVAQKLAEAQRLLTAMNPDLHLLVYDAIRPREVQTRMWVALDSIPVSQRVNFVSNPKNGSIHNYGAAVDLTICDANGKPLDMGAGFDDIRKIAYPSMEKRFLHSGELTQLHIDNRNILRGVMRKAGFSSIPTEWWHFNSCSRQTAKSKYKIMETEADIFVSN